MERHTRQGQGRRAVTQVRGPDEFEPLDGAGRRRGRGGVRGPHMPVIAAGGCWCGESLGHDWPGKSDGEPHPRAA